MREVCAYSDGSWLKVQRVEKGEEKIRGQNFRGGGNKMVSEFQLDGIGRAQTIMYEISRLFDHGAFMVVLPYHNDDFK